MQCIIRKRNRHREWLEVVSAVAVLSVILLASRGLALESSGGWMACPPRLVGVTGKRRGRRSRARRRPGIAWRAGWVWMQRSWRIAALRSWMLLGLAGAHGRAEWEWVCLLPWLAWLWKGLGLASPGLGARAWYRGLGWLWERAGGVAMLGLGVLWLGGDMLATQETLGLGVIGLGGLETGGLSRVDVERDAEGVYHVRLRGTFELQVDGTVEFYKRMLVVFLGLLDVPGETRKSRRTRDGRTPFVRQEQLAAWFGVPHPVISRWSGYWLKQDWRRMLSQRHGELLTLDVQHRVVEVWVQFPWWSAQRVYDHLRAQGSQITLSQVKQVGRESGWTALRQELQQVYQIGKASFRPRDEWLVEQLLSQIAQLVAQLEAVNGLPAEQQTSRADLEAVCRELDLHPAPARRPLPWMMRLEHLLWGHWDAVDDGTVRCIYCGATHVSRKSRAPRLKTYIDAHGEEQTVEVYRYYCHNPQCEYQSFTNLPPHLVPHSQWTVQHHLAALQQYEWSHSIYRCTGQMLGVSKMTAYRWVSAFGYQLLPVAALFGVVRSSGVVGIDEKYVLVPKNDKPAEKMKRWMYVYVAVDCYTYDLLHIDIYPYNTKHSAQAFLLALRAKGYHPRVVVTDMRVDYHDVVARVFPDAVHHECIFHALQAIHRTFKEVYGADFAPQLPHVKALQEAIDAIFDAQTQRTAHRRFDQVMSHRQAFVTVTPEADAIFAFLDRHWPRLVNAIESRIVPSTNNATEQVIRNFTQHYKTCCGFESRASARLYLAVFEKVYRFTPFSADAQARIRGKCPLELAGYEVQKLPMTQLFRGLALQWPAQAFQELVPNG